MSKNKECSFNMNEKYAELKCYSCNLRLGNNKCELGSNNYAKGLINSPKDKTMERKGE